MKNSQLSDAETEARDKESSPSLQKDRPRSRVSSLLAGLLTSVVGVLWFLYKFDDGVYYGRMGRREYTFDENPILVTLFLTGHATVILIGLAGVIFGSRPGNSQRDKKHSD